MNVNYHNCEIIYERVHDDIYIYIFFVFYFSTVLEFELFKPRDIDQLDRRVYSGHCE